MTVGLHSDFFNTISQERSLLARREAAKTSDQPSKARHQLQQDAPQPVNLRCASAIRSLHILLKCWPALSPDFWGFGDTHRTEEIFVQATE
jgi:hypothetical protein